MKKFGFILGKPFMVLLALALVLGLTLAGCKNEPDDVPIVSNPRIGTKVNGVFGSSLNGTEGIVVYFRFAWDATHQPIQRFELTIKKDKVVWQPATVLQKSPPVSGHGTEEEFGPYTLALAGTYDFDVVAVDIDGKKSKAQGSTIVVTASEMPYMTVK